MNFATLSSMSTVITLTDITNNIFLFVVEPRFFCVVVAIRNIQLKRVRESVKRWKWKKNYLFFVVIGKKRNQSAHDSKEFAL
jgi:hypothetical protein